MYIVIYLLNTHNYVLQNVYKNLEDESQFQEVSE